MGTIGCKQKFLHWSEPDWAPCIKPRGGGKTVPNGTKTKQGAGWKRVPINSTFRN